MGAYTLLIIGNDGKVKERFTEWSLFKLLLTVIKKGVR